MKSRPKSCLKPLQNLASTYQTLAKYALQGYTNPIGVAEWEKQITTSLPHELKSSLPTVEEIEQEMGKG